MKDKLKTIWNKVKKPFNWHVYPTTNDLIIKSFVEFLFYLFITAGLIYLFTIWHNVPERNIMISVDKGLRNDSCHKDSTLRISAGVRLEIPMTNRNINYDGGLRTTLSLKKDSVDINEYHKPIHYKVNEKSLNSDIYDTIKTIQLPENLYLADSLIKYINHLDINRKNSLIYFSLYYNRGPWGVRKPSQKLYDPVVNDENDTTHSFRETHFHSKYFVDKVVYNLEDHQSNLYCTSEGEVLGRPVWYRLEDISQSYYNIRFNSISMDSLSLEIDFKGAVDFSNMIPKPDEVGMGNIKFFNQDKIRQIEMNGLRFHAKFRELENMQTIRLFAVTTILGGILIIFVGLLFVGIYYMGKIWKRHKFTVSFVLIILVLLLLYYFNGLSYIYYTFISN